MTKRLLLALVLVVVGYSSADAAGNSFLQWISGLNAPQNSDSGRFMKSDGTWDLPPAFATKLQVTGSDVSNSTTTPAIITGLSFTAAAATPYTVNCIITATGTATSLPRFNLVGPASPTLVTLRTDRAITTSTQTVLVLQAFNAAAQTAACTNSCAATALVSHFYGTIMNGANAGTVALQVASSTAGQTVTVARGSACTVY